jgi:hypothetical protein
VRGQGGISLPTYSWRLSAAVMEGDGLGVDWVAVLGARTDDAVTHFRMVGCSTSAGGGRRRWQEAATPRSEEGRRVVWAWAAWATKADGPTGATGPNVGKLLGWGGGGFRVIRLCTDGDDFV